MINNYNNFNESMKRKGRNSGRFQQQNSWKEEVPRFTKVIEPRGMGMVLSDRFKYVVDKIAKKGNKISQELLTLPNKPDAKFEYSYIDLTGRNDTLSYLQNGDRSTPDEQRFTTNKRQQSKVYKVIKTIFASKYTKTEVGKFVSMFNSVYSQGPDENIARPKPTKEQIVKKLIVDTKNGKLKWRIVPGGGDIIKFETRVELTKNKCLLIILFKFITKEELSFLTLNIYDGLKTDKTSWLQTIPNAEILDLITILKKDVK